MKLGKYIATNIQDYLNEENQSLLAPNSKPSNLSQTLYKYVRTDEFKGWFGDQENDLEHSSKVIDKNGEPLVVYHGTSNIFNTPEFKITDNVISGYGIKEYGIYFTNSIFTAKDYASKPEENKDYLEQCEKLDRLKSEKDYDGWTELYNYGKDKYKPNRNISKNGRIFECFLNIRDPFIKDANGKYQFTAFKNINFSGDGVIMYNVIEVYNDIQTTYIVYDKNQIKIINTTNLEQ